MTEQDPKTDEADDTEGNHARKGEADDTEGHGSRVRDAAVEADDTEGHGKVK